MAKQWQFFLGVLLVISVSSFCKTNHTYGTVAAYAQDRGPIDTFRVKYEFDLAGRTKKIDSRLYVGMLFIRRRIGNNAYKELIFGDSLTSAIALVRQTEEGLYYIPTSAADAKKEKPLLLFNKKVNEKWEVNVADGYLWQKEITFTGIQHTDNDDLYVYKLETKEGYIAIGNQVTKIYYSKKNGFVKLAVKTHWITLEVEKSK